MRTLDFSMSTLALFARDNGEDLNTMVNGMTLDLLGIIKLTYYAIDEGARRDNKDLPEGFDWRMVGDWFTEEPLLAGKVLSLYYDSQGLTITDEESEEVEKLSA